MVRYESFGTLRILIATEIMAVGLNLAQDLRVEKGVRVLGVVSDLSQTYDASEHSVPNLVIVGCSLAERPEFEVLKLLMAALQIRYLIFFDSNPESRIHAPCFPRGQYRIYQVSEILETAVLRSVEQQRALPISKPEGHVRKGSGEQHPAEFDDGLVLLGASTGGVDALLTVLSTFPEDCPATVIVQHTGSGFTAGLARVLNSQVKPEVVEYASQDVRPGRAFIAPGGDAHLVFGAGKRPRLRLLHASANTGHRPSIDRMFRSASHYGPRVSAALLTGMGRDGATGLLALREAGAFTLVQNEATCVVYGMPRAAKELGAACEELPIDRIGPALLNSRKRTTHVISA